jgi:hypothetical protein
LGRGVGLDSDDMREERDAKPTAEEEEDEEEEDAEESGAAAPELRGSASVEPAAAGASMVAPAEEEEDAARVEAVDGPVDAMDMSMAAADTVESVRGITVAAAVP